MTDEKLNEISGLVADAMCQEDFTALADDLDEALDGVPSEERRKALAKAQITCLMASDPGCLPDFFIVYPIDADPDDIREEIMLMMGEDNPDDDEVDWDAIREQVDALDLAGSSIDAPDGLVIEIFRKSCAEVLHNNGMPSDNGIAKRKAHFGNGQICLPPLQLLNGRHKRKSGDP